MMKLFVALLLALACLAKEEASRPEDKDLTIFFDEQTMLTKEEQTEIVLETLASLRDVQKTNLRYLGSQKSHDRIILSLRYKKDIAQVALKLITYPDVFAIESNDSHWFNAEVSFEQKQAFMREHSAESIVLKANNNVVTDRDRENAKRDQREKLKQIREEAGGPIPNKPKQGAPEHPSYPRTPISRPTLGPPPMSSMAKSRKEMIDDL